MSNPAVDPAVLMAADLPPLRWWQREDGRDYLSAYCHHRYREARQQGVLALLFPSED